MENVFGFNMASYRACKNLWKSCVEYHTFFCSRAQSTNHISDDTKQGIIDISYGLVIFNSFSSYFVSNNL